MIVVFDATCLLCNGSVRFLLRHDHREVLQFASLQGAVGRRLIAAAGLEPGAIDSVLVVDGERTLQDSEALLALSAALGWPWKLGGLARLCPVRLRDALYRWVARNRYRWFGRSPVCLMPSAEHAGRFLD